MIKKNNLAQTILSYIVGVGLLGLLAWVVVKIAVLFWDLITHSQPTIGAAIIAGCCTILISVFSAIWNSRTERNKELELKRKEIEQEHRKEKIPAYTEFIAFLFKVFDSQRTNTSMSPDETIKAIQEFTQKILIWGNSSIIKDYGIFSEHAVAQEERKSRGETLSPFDDMITTLMFEKLLYDIRADLGHDNKGLGEGDLTTLFVRGFPEEMKKYKVTNQASK